MSLVPLLVGWSVANAAWSAFAIWAIRVESRLAREGREREAGIQRGSAELAEIAREVNASAQLAAREWAQIHHAKERLEAATRVYEERARVIGEEVKRRLRELRERGEEDDA